MMFNETIRTLRKQRGYSQEEVAGRLNVVRQTVSKWEKVLHILKDIANSNPRLYTQQPYRGLFSCTAAVLTISFSQTPLLVSGTTLLIVVFSIRAKRCRHNGSCEP